MSITAIQQEYIEQRKKIDASETLFGLSRTMAVHAARMQLRNKLIHFASTGKMLESMIQDAIDMFELEAAS